MHKRDGSFIPAAFVIPMLPRLLSLCAGPRVGLLALFLLDPAIASDQIGFHSVRTDAQGRIVPWYDSDPGKAYDHVLGLVWKFWRDIRTDQNGLPYYLNHQVWQADRPDNRGIGSDQFASAMESWRLYYAYTGDRAVRENWRLLADWYLTRSLSPLTYAWPNLPFPYNTLVYSEMYDGDMVLGVDYLQPDKAGQFGLELLNLYKAASGDRFPRQNSRRYLAAAIGIADTLAGKVRPGDAEHSPLPFKVNARTGEVGDIEDNNWQGSIAGHSAYSTNWAPTVRLWKELSRLGLGRRDLYDQAAATVVAWVMQYPMKTQRWGPYFEDIPGWSDTQICAIQWLTFILDYRAEFPNWQADCQRILDWTYHALGNDEALTYGVKLIVEQTIDPRPGNSHNARQAAAELQLAALTGDSSLVEPAVRKLNWSTYQVDHDGKNQYPRGPVWMTDGYGDYVRHYLRAMGFRPELAPSGRCVLLNSSSVVQQVNYHPTTIPQLRPNVQVIYGPVKHIADDAKLMVAYVTFDAEGQETLRLTRKPSKVYLEELELPEGATAQAYTWQPLDVGGVLRVKRTAGRRVFIIE